MDNIPPYGYVPVCLPGRQWRTFGWVLLLCCCELGFSDIYAALFTRVPVFSAWAYTLRTTIGGSDIII